ncbi:Translation initiation factor if-2 [Thalictrum thalictroides]|uniref:Eukaryotic translation initiation factor 5B n=1 Tax=Thalictrum thalictroides TaxID=46969 RepID=A0A7J6V6N4_THATH|nr:Translation initiation factor if-2 [Thalictrum thalictroides]
MGRKKPTSNAVDENPVAGGGKSKKKNRGNIDDDEYSIETMEENQSKKSQDEEVVAPGIVKAGKKKGKKKVSKEEDDISENAAEDDEGVVPVVNNNNNNKKKSKPKRSNGFSVFDADDEDKIDGSNDNDDEDVPAFDFGGKKKPSKKSSSKKSGSLFAALDEQDNDDAEDDDNDDVPAYDFGTKKKPSKKSSSKISGSLFASLDKKDDGDDDAEDDDNDAVPAFDFGAKKKPSKKSSSKKSVSLFAALDEEDDDTEEENNVEPEVTFSGKKKPSKSSTKSNSLFSAAALLDADNEMDAVSVDANIVDVEQEDGDVPEFTFSGKKKSSKSKKKNNQSMASDEVSNANALGESNLKDCKVNNQEVEAVETSKNKKKKKKSGRTAQEEDDLDKILAELGEAPPVAKATPPQPQLENAEVKTDSLESTEISEEKKEAEAETAESAAAKKKKKKKEKEKEKKAAAVSAVEVKEENQETKSKVSDNKKIPKHVREMQEALARRKEAEERQKKEEEEKLRREEEERQRLEEVERQAEEAKRRKKEREKEKMLRKKQEGKLLTGKQKEEARRLEAMRNQFLASAALPTNETGTTTTKRPKYQTKKAKPVPGQANSVQPVKSEDSTEAKEIKQEVVAKEDVVEDEKVEEIVSVARDDEQEEEVEPVVQESGGEEDEDDDDWDAKSWDDATLNLNVKSAFDEEEVEEEAEGVSVPVAKKVAKPNTKPAPETAGALPAEAKPSVAARKDSIPGTVKSQDDESKEDDATDKKRRKEAAAKREARAEEANSKRSAENLRSPICCIMGHVDTGKTKLLDCIRRTNVQEGEAGGITQQIGATYFPAKNIRERTRELKEDATLQVPGLLVIDTPGHESFANLRSRGSGLCDIAILVVDIMHGLEPQTIESLNLLKMRNTDFIIALNKVDRLYGWKSCPNGPIVKAMKQQSNDVQNEFKMRVKEIINQFQMEGLNTELYYKNKEMGETYSIVPTSAISGEGVPDLLLLLVMWTQKKMVDKLMFSDIVQCTVLEVKVIEGLGTTIDVVLVNGVLRESDQIVVCGMQGPIVTTIRALLTPHPMKELRVKGSYVHHKEIKAAQGIKITGQGLEHAIPGTALYVVRPDDDLDDAKEAAMEDMNSVMSRIDKSGEGVCVQASTLGSLEALLEFLKSPAVNIPKDPIVVGVDVLEGIAKVGTPICIPSRDFIDIGRIVSIENNHKQVDMAKKGQKVAIKIAGTNPEEQQKSFGRHFEMEDELVSHITRSSIDVLKTNYREDLSLDNWKLVVKLKNLFKIQ